ncbi:MULTISPECIES: DNA polymerase III subunit gamma/tau [Thermodesulfovibrio]|jgi:DNA polymerase-3 subunit gamma/tau|uniref:DNA polymerase III subunit gamma/tau n=1 Tax=Thermodesulfovibrio TaxID=28261 RepID=UPI002614404F|nr:DNA polymerase III subunit gamma/tau [Thermodesulfovibrio sp.]
MAYLGLARKYRPQKFSDLIGQEIIVKILQNSLKSNKLSHAYVFSGPKGVGKTSTARILAKALNCQNEEEKPCDNCPSCIAVKEGKAMSVIEIDAASHTSVENIRDLRENIRYASAEGLYKVYIIDEAHMLSQAAFNAFLKTLEEPPPHVVFVLATTEPKKIPLTVLSRCQHLQFRRISINSIKERLETICKEEDIKITDEALRIIASNAEGSMRDALTLLDQIAAYADEISVEELNLLLGTMDVKILYELSEYIIYGNREKLIFKIDELNDCGTDFKLLTRDLINFLRNLLIKKVAGEKIIFVSEEELNLLKELEKKTSEEHLILILKELINSEYSIKNSLFPRINFELALLRLSMLSSFRNIDSVMQEFKKHKEEEKTEEKYEISGEYTFEEKWQNFLKKLDTENHILAAKIKQANVNFTDEEIQLIYNGGSTFCAESVRERLQEIEELMRQAGLNKRILVKEHKKSDNLKDNFSLNANNNNEKVLENKIVKEALQLFEGRIYNIIPKRGGKNV